MNKPIPYNISIKPPPYNTVLQLKQYEFNLFLPSDH